MFTDDDFPLEGRDHHKTLFIKAEVKGKLTCCVMVDNGSTINVCPLKIFPKLGLTEANLKPSEVVIKAYDDTKRPVAGTFRALVKTGLLRSGLISMSSTSQSPLLFFGGGRGSILWEGCLQLSTRRLSSHTKGR